MTTRLAPRLLLLALAFSLPVLDLRAQATTEPVKRMPSDASPGFAVATIKPSDRPASEGWAFPDEGNRVVCTNATLGDILSIAYGIHRRQIVDAPDWVFKDRWDINGVPDVPGSPNVKQMQQMFRKLFAERFGLVFHNETRKIPIYALTVAKGGPHLEATKPGDTTNTGNSGSPGVRILKFSNMSIANFALNMNMYEDRPVIDQTRLPDNYNFTLRWTYDVAREDAPDAPPSLFTAIREQLGLRVDAVNGPAEVFVIDRVEKPSAN